MLSDNRHWLDYDPVALAVLLIGIGCVELIVLSICHEPSLGGRAQQHHSDSSGSQSAFMTEL